MSQDDLARIRAESTAQTFRETQNTANVAANTAKLAAVSTAITALPAPVNAATRILGDGLYAAFKFPVTGVRQPAPVSADPIKLMAYAMAFSILKALWCFIKSLLNPLPFIGSFFPLCPNDPDGVGSDSSDPDNIKLNQASMAFAGAVGNIESLQGVQAPPGPSGDFGGSNNPPGAILDVGESFEEYISRTAGFSGVASVVVEDNQKRDQREEIIQIVPTSQTPVVNPAIEPGTSKGVGLGEEFTNDLRRGFGL